MTQTIEVLYAVDATTKTDVFTAGGSSVTMGPHSTSIEFTGGVHEDRPVLGVLYADARRVIRYGDGAPDG